MGFEKARNYLKNNQLVALPFDKGVGFCVMKKHTYYEKLTKLTESKQFERYDKMDDSVVHKFEKKNLSKKLLAMNRRNEITDGLYARLRSTVSQSARLYGLAKVQKKDTPLRTVLSLPGSFYEKLNKTLAKFLIKSRVQISRPTLKQPGL